MNATVERVRAVLRTLGNDEITPMGRRMIEKVLDAEESVEDGTEGGYTVYPAGYRSKHGYTVIPRTEGTQQDINFQSIEALHEKD